MLAQPIITPPELATLLGRPDAPRIVDVRIDDDVAENPVFIPGGARTAPWEVVDLPCVTSETILVCHRGLKLSQGAAAELRARGGEARALEGGMVAWIASGLPTIATDPGDARAWVHRHDPDRWELLNAWLVRRFICPAPFLRVATDQIGAVAERFNARLLPQDPAQLLEDTALHLPGQDALIAAIGALPDPLFDGMAALARNEADHLDRAFGVFDALYEEVRP